METQLKHYFEEAGSVRRKQLQDTNNYRVKMEAAKLGPREQEETALVGVRRVHPSNQI